MEPFRKADQRRIRRAAERAEKAKQRERRIVQGTGITVVILFLLLVLAAVWLYR
jgi:CHASE3 domain sensor protein